MPSPVTYINFRATLPGEYGPKEYRNCMGYLFVGGVYEARIPEKDARIADRVLVAFYDAKTEEVPDVVSPVSKPAGANKSPAKAKTADEGTSDRAKTGDGAKTATVKRGKSDATDSGKTKRAAKSTVGPKSTSSESGPDSADDELV